MAASEKTIDKVFSQTNESQVKSSNNLLCIRDKPISFKDEKLRKSLERKFLVIMVATFTVNFMTVMFSIYSNSISLIADAIHGLFDVILMLGCYISVRLSRKQATNEFTYGYHRLETVVSVTINIVFLCLLFMCIIPVSYTHLTLPTTPYV